MNSSYRQPPGWISEGKWRKPDTKGCTLYYRPIDVTSWKRQNDSRKHISGGWGLGLPRSRAQGKFLGVMQLVLYLMVVGAVWLYKFVKVQKGVPLKIRVNVTEGKLNFNKPAKKPYIYIHTKIHKDEASFLMLRKTQAQHGVTSARPSRQNGTFVT